MISRLPNSRPPPPTSSRGRGHLWWGVGAPGPPPPPFLRVAVNAGALPLVLLESSALEAEGEALAMGARAALQSDIPTSSLAAALAAVDAGLIVLEPSARALLLSANRERFAGGGGHTAAPGG